LHPDPVSHESNILSASCTLTPFPLTPFPRKQVLARLIIEKRMLPAVDKNTCMKRFGKGKLLHSPPIRRHQLAKENSAPQSAKSIWQKEETRALNFAVAVIEN
jgi:hypothetical protein